MWDLWLTKWRWGTFSPATSVSPDNLYSTNFSKTQKNNDKPTNDNKNSSPVNRVIGEAHKWTVYEDEQKWRPSGEGIITPSLHGLHQLLGTR
jgi:hypothetical protein